MASAIPVAWSTLMRLLRETDWPSLPESSGVRVWFGDPAAPPETVGATDESVVVIGQVETDESEFATAGRISTAEQFGLLVVVSTMVRPRSPEQVACRLFELADVVERIIGTTVRHQDRPPEFATAEIWKWEVARRRPIVGPMNEGFGGQVELLVRVTARLPEEVR